jgi:hypothetical protein
VGHVTNPVGAGQAPSATAVANADPLNRERENRDPRTRRACIAVSNGEKRSPIGDRPAFPSLSRARPIAGDRGHSFGWSRVSLWDARARLGDGCERGELCLGGEESPTSGHALELMLSPILELDS